MATKMRRREKKWRFICVCQKKVVILQAKCVYIREKDTKYTIYSARLRARMRAHAGG